MIEMSPPWIDVGPRLIVSKHFTNEARNLDRSSGGFGEKKGLIYPLLFCCSAFQHARCLQVLSLAETAWLLLGWANTYLYVLVPTIFHSLLGYLHRYLFACQGGESALLIDLFCEKA